MPFSSCFCGKMSLPANYASNYARRPSTNRKPRDALITLYETDAGNRRRPGPHATPTRTTKTTRRPNAARARHWRNTHKKCLRCFKQRARLPPAAGRPPQTLAPKHYLGSCGHPPLCCCRFLRNSCRFLLELATTGSKTRKDRQRGRRALSDSKQMKMAGRASS